MHHLNKISKLSFAVLLLTFGFVSRSFGQTTCPVSNEITITVVAEPNISILGATTICAGGTATLNATINNGTGTCTLQWQSSANGTSGWTNVGTVNSNTYLTAPLATTTYYRATYTCTGSGCDASASNTIAITVVPDLTIQAQPQPITQCVDGTLQLSVTPTAGTGTGTITYQWQSSTDGSTGWTAVLGATSSTYTPISTSAGTTFYRVIVSASGVGCDATTSNPARVEITPDLTVGTQPQPITECIGGALTMSVTPTVGTGVGTISYQWQTSNDGTTGWANVSGATASTFTPPSTAAGTKYYRAIISATGNGCGPVTSNPAAATITDDVSITNQPQNITECVGGTLPISVTVANGTGTVTYQWQSSANGTSGWTPILGATASTYTPLSTIATTTYYRVIVTVAGNGCDPITSANAQVDVIPDLTISAQPQPFSECVGGTLQLSVTPTVGTGVGAITYQWESSTNGTSGWTAISGETASTFTPPSTAQGTTYYRVVISAAGNGCGPVTSNSTQVQIIPDLTVSAQPQPITECIGGALTMSVTPTVGTGVGTITYQWETSANGTSGWTAISGATASTFTPPSTAAGVLHYRVVISASGSGCGPVTSNSATNTVINDVNITDQPDAITECVGGTTQLSVAVANGTGTITYQWESSTNGTSGWAAISGATSSTYTPLSTTVGVVFYRVIVSVAGNGCDGTTSANARVEIVPDLTVATQPLPINQCLGGNLPLTVVPTAGTGVGTLSYQWESSSNGTSGWTPVSGATSSTYTPLSTAVGVTYYRAIISATGDGCGSVTSNSARVEIFPELSISSQPAPTITQCQGGSLPLSVTVQNATGTITYQWQSSANGTSGWANILGATASTYVPLSTTVGITYYRVIVSASGNGCDDVTSNNARVEITPDISITGQPQDVTECVGGNLPISVTVADGTGTITYQWQSSANGTSGWTNILGATASTYTPSSTTQGTTYYHVIVTVSGNGCDPVTSANSKVDIIPDLTVDVHPQPITECLNGNLQLSVTPTANTGVGTITYQWESSTNGTSGWTPISGATASTYTPPSTAVGVIFYRAVINTSGSGCDSRASNAARVEIVPELIVTNQPDDIVECQGGTTQLSVAVTNGTGTITYQWESSINGTSGWTAIAGATSSTYTPLSTTVGVTFYRVVVSASGNGCDDVTSNNARVEITPDVNITAQPQDVTECIGGNLPISVTVANGTGTITYQWQASTNGTSGWTPILGATNSTYTPSSTTAGVTFYHVIVTVSGNGCDPITSANSRVEVVPDLTVGTQPQNITECIDGTLELSVTPTAGTGVGTITYQWESSPDNSAWSPVSGATASTYMPPSATAGAIYYRVVISASGNGCGPVTSNPALVTIVAKPVVNISVPATAVCVGGFVTLNSSTSGGTGTCTIQWQNSTNGGTTWGDIPGGTTPSFTTPALSNDTKYRARYTCSGSGCCNP